MHPPTMKLLPKGELGPVLVIRPRKPHTKHSFPLKPKFNIANLIQHNSAYPEAQCGHDGRSMAGKDESAAGAPTGTGLVAGRGGCRL